MDSHALYRDLAYVFVAAVLGGAIAQKLRQPTILGYVLGGILIGPFTPGPTISDVHSLELLAEVGVILLMYSIGIEFSPKDLLEVKWIALLGAPIGVLGSIGLGIVLALVSGWPLAEGAALGAIVSVASTMVLSRLLIDRGELLSPHGKVMIGLTLVEDLAVVLLTILLPAFGSLGRESFTQIAVLLGKALIILVPALFLAAKLVPALLGRVARLKNDELFLLVVVALGFATAAITQALGLSLALGAFLAGMVVSGSDYAHQTLSRVLPIRDLFVALFFVTIGALINPRMLWSHPILLLEILALIVVGKFIVWAAITRAFQYSWQTSFLVAIGLTQIGEFSYVLLRVGRDASVVTDSIYNATLMASLLSILLNAALFRVASQRMTRA